jgi:hypothetical protein
MQKFTEAYEKARDVVLLQQYDNNWQPFLRDTCKVTKLLDTKGFASTHEKSLELIRARVAKLAKEGKADAGSVIYDASVNAKSPGAIGDRAATLKFLKHVYRVHKIGGQTVWVYAPPKADSGWVFDEVTGDVGTMKARLKHEEEIFSSTERKWMSKALSLSRKICEDAKSKLGGGKVDNIKASAKSKIERWFLDQDSDADTLANVVQKLNGGFKKIAAACNKSTLVFADYPDWRARRDQYFGAAFRGGEGGGFPVIYLEGAFTRLTGNSGKAWLCAETIIHEFSHHEVSTQDHFYDSDGLKPDKAAFPYEKAIDNADNWGYFALDLAGYLSKADFEKVWK